MAKKPRKKKFSTTLQGHANNRYLLKDKVLLYTGGNNQVVMGRILPGRVLPMPYQEPYSAAVEASRHPWSVYIAVFGRAEDGREYMNATCVVAMAPLFYNELGPLAERIQDEMIDEMNQRHFCNAAWCASPTGRDFEEEHAEKLFAGLGVWDVLSRWEADQLPADEPLIELPYGNVA